MYVASICRAHGNGHIRLFARLGFGAVVAHAFKHSCRREEGRVGRRREGLVLSPQLRRGVASVAHQRPEGTVSARTSLQTASAG